MPRNITITFDDGSTHVYQNAPDDITPDAVQARAEQEFGLGVTNIDGGRKAAAPAPEKQGFFASLDDKMNSVFDAVKGGFSSEPKGSVLQGATLPDLQLDPALNEQAMLRSKSPESLMFTAGRTKQRVDAAVERGKKVEALARQGGYNSVPEMVDALAKAEDRKKFAQENPNVGALASGSANMLRGTINAPGAAAGFVNKTVVDPVLGLVGAGPMPDAPTALGTDALKGMAADFMPAVGKLSLDKAWEKGVFGEWLAAQVSAQVPQMPGQIAAVFNPVARAAVLPVMGAQSAGNSYADGDDPRVAIAKGVVEVLSEGASFGVADKIKDVLLKMPSGVQQSIFKSVATKALAAGGAVTGQMLAGSIEESVAQLGNNALDIYASGKDKALTEGVKDAAVVGAAVNVGMGLPNVVTAMQDNSPQARAARELSALLNGGEYSRAQLDEMGATNAGVLTNPNLRNAKPSAPTVESQPTTPTAPPSTSGRSVAQQILDLENGTADGVPSVPAASVPAGSADTTPSVGDGGGAAAGSGADTGAGGAVQNSQPGQPTAGSAAPGSVVPTGTDPRTEALAAIEKSLAESRARQEAAAEAKVEAEKAAQAEAAAAEAERMSKANFAQTTMNTAQPTGDVPVVGQAQAVVEKASTVAAKNNDLADQKTYPTPVLYGIVNSPDAGPELLNAARTELERRKGNPVAPDVSMQTTSTLSPQAQSLQQRMQAGQNANNGTNTGTTSAGVVGQPSTGAGTPTTGRATNVLQTGSGASQPATGTPALSNQNPSGQTAVADLPLADAAPADVFDGVQRKLYQKKKVIVRRSQRPLTYQQQIVSKLARMSGKTVTWIERSSGAEKDMPNGFVNSFEGDHYFMDADSTHPALEILMHEGVHALPNHIRAKLKAVVLKNLSAAGKAAFLKEYGYDKESGDIQDEEATAYVTQQIVKNPEFFQDLRKALGNKDFAELAKVIISKIRNWFQNPSDFDRDFLKNNVANLKDVHDAAVAAYAQAMQEQGLQPDATVVNEPVYATKPEGEDASIQHQMEIERETRELAATTRLSASEQTAIGSEAKRLGITKTKLELEVRRIKAQFPTSGGWAPMEFSKVNKAKYAKKGVLSMDTVEFKKQPYDFHLGTGGKDDSATHAKRVTAIAKGISDEIIELLRKSEQGDKNAKITMDQIGWYSKVATMLHHQFGGFADFLAQLMGPTSANTPVEGNVKYAMAALKSAMSGKWDSLVADTIRWHEGVMQAAAGLDAVIDANKALPKDKRLTIKDLSETKEFKDAMAAVEAAAPYTGEEPQQDSGAKFGMATQGVVEILANSWSDFQRGDAPKTKNYYQNLIGRQFTGATIDVWAARTLRRMAGLLRLPTSAEKGVAGKIGANLKPGAEFGFGQEAFTKAAENLRNSGIADFANTTPADVQAMIWFSEKENWARNNWTNKIGEGGSAEAEFNLQGNEDRDGLEDARRLSRKGLPYEGNTKPNKTEEKVQEASAAAGVGQFPTARDTPQYKARLEKIIAKAVQARNEARVQFEAMRGTVDRWIAGVTPATDFTPSDATMAEAGAELESKVAMGEDAHKVLAFKALPTMGRYGYDERSLDFEGITRQGYNGTDMLRPLLELAKERAQDGLLFGRVLRADEDIDYLRHRPGIELYLAKGTTMEKAQPLLDKLNELGFQQFTFVVDPVRTPAALSGKMGNVVGLRYIFTPEFALREPNPEYGGDQTWSPAGLTDDQIRSRMQEKARSLFKIATELRKIDGVSSAEHRSYEANVYFWGDYDNALGDVGRGSEDSGSTAGWQGQPTRTGLEGADRRREMDPSSEDAKSFGARRDVLRGDSGSIPFSNKPGSGRTVEPDGQDGPGARASAVRVQGTHFSQQPRTNLDGRYNGTGLKGAERTRLSLSQDSRIKERVYFYVDEGNGIRPESGVGGVAHTADLRNIYDVTGDKAGLFKSSNNNQNESALLDAGYSGYYVPKVFNNQGVVVVLGNASRGIKVTPTDYAKGSAPVEAPQPYKRALTGKELNAIDLPALQAAAPSAKLRMGNLTLDAGEVGAARAELAKQGISLPDTAPVFSNKKQDLNQDIVLEIPVEGGKTAKLTVNAQRYIDQLNAREDALRMVKECMS